MRMGTRLQYDLCSHVYSHYPSTAKGSLLPPLWLKYHCRSPEKTIANAEAVHLLLSLWLRTDLFYINKEYTHISEGISDSQVISSHAQLSKGETGRLFWGANAKDLPRQMFAL